MAKKDIILLSYDWRDRVGICRNTDFKLTGNLAVFAEVGEIFTTLQLTHTYLSPVCLKTLCNYIIQNTLGHK